MDRASLLDLERHVGLGEADARALRELRPILEPHVAELGREWIDTLCDGETGEASLASRKEAARRHLERGGSERDLVVATSRARRLTSSVARRGSGDDAAAERIVEAIDKRADLDLAIMLDVLRETRVARAIASDRRETVGALAAKVGHVLRGRLGTILSSVRLIERHLEAPGNERLAREADVGLAAVKRRIEGAAAIIAALLRLRQDPGVKLRPVDLNYLVREAVTELEPPPWVRLELRLDPALPRLPGDADLLETVVTSLGRNAIEAQGERPGTVTITTEARGEVVLLTVADEGPGLPDDVARRLFEPFTTTKPGAGGLGLAVCREAVRLHEGRIEGRNRDGGRGAEFRVSLGTRER